MALRFVTGGLLLLACAHAAAHNHIFYECVDANGAKTFTNIPANPKGCKVLSVSPSSGPAVPTPAAPSGNAKAPRPAPAASPSSFPRVDRALQQERDNDRRRILENELDNEEKLLAGARKDLTAQESVRHGNENNYQRVLDRLEPFQKKVKLHEDNVANLRREISKLR